MTFSRRNFLAGSVATSVAFASPVVHGANANTKYRTALIGSGWWGMNILRTGIQAGDCDVVALCDVDQRQLARTALPTFPVTGS